MPFFTFTFSVKRVDSTCDQEAYPDFVSSEIVIRDIPSATRILERTTNFQNLKVKTYRFMYIMVAFIFEFFRVDGSVCQVVSLDEKIIR